MLQGPIKKKGTKMAKKKKEEMKNILRTCRVVLWLHTPAQEWQLTDWVRGGMWRIAKMEEVFAVRRWARAHPVTAEREGQGGSISIYHRIHSNSRHICLTDRHTFAE